MLAEITPSITEIVGKRLAQHAAARAFDRDDDPAALAGWTSTPRIAASRAENSSRRGGKPDTRRSKCGGCAASLPASEDRLRVIASRHAPSASRRAGRAEHDLIHPDEEAVAADDADGDDGPDRKARMKKATILLPAGMRNGRETGLVRRHIRLPARVDAGPEDVRAAQPAGPDLISAARPLASWPPAHRCAGEEWRTGMVRGGAAGDYAKPGRRRGVAGALKAAEAALRERKKPLKTQAFSRA